MIGKDRKRAASLGIRIGIVFLAAVVIVILAAYYVFSRNFHNLLFNYTVNMVQAMSDQGVQVVENELAIGRKEAIVLADSFQTPAAGVQSVTFPELLSEDEFIRMLYVSEEESFSSDGRKPDVRERPDIQAAFSGETAVYGPYYNEENEYIVCYCAPVKQDGSIIGALCIEKDGYRFCDLIQNIQFADSGEAYIINAEGTDIAVSRQEHLDWVKDQYNSQKIYDTQMDQETKSILELERKGLNGESGIGTYYWHDGLCYVIYQPIPSVNWVLLAGLREEEIAAMTQSAFFSSISKGPVLEICLLLFLALTGLIIFWIISSMKKEAEINEKLEIIANHDSLTGLLNRRFLESKLSEVWEYPVRASSQAAVFMMDIDNFKKYNDYYGHVKGDDCLRRVADIFKNAFEDYSSNVIRYGGEEFLAAAFLVNHPSALELGQKICRQMADEQMPDSQGGIVTVSVGICYVKSTLNASLYDCIQIADQALYQAKKEGKNRAVLIDAPDKEESPVN